MSRLSERLRTLQAQRGEAVAAYESALTKALDENRELTAEEETQQTERRALLDKLDPQIEATERDLRILATRAQPLMTTTALPATVPAQPSAIERDGRGKIVRVGNPVIDEYVGAGFVRMFLCKALAKGDMALAEQIAIYRYGNKDFGDIMRQYEWHTKAAVPPMSTGEAIGSGGGSALIITTHMGEQFIDLLRPLLIVNKLPNTLNLNFNGAGKIIIPRQIGGVTGSYIGEGVSITTQRLNFDQIALTPSKLAVLAPYTNEMLRRSDPGFERLVLNDLTQGTARTIDQSFFVNTAVAPAPAGILTYKAQLAAGNILAAATVAQVSDAFRAIITQLRLANVPMTSPAWIMNPRTVEYLRLLRAATVEVYAFKDEIDRGTLFGWPIVASTTVAISAVDQSAPYALIDCSQIIWADDMAPVLDASEEATIQADTAPATPPAAPYLSAFQQDMVISRIRMSHTWSVRHPEAVSWATSIV